MNAVKQAIAWSSILPWSTFWRRSAPVRTNIYGRSLHSYTSHALSEFPNGSPFRDHVLRTGTPEGGITLHWIACVFFICVSAGIKNIGEAISFLRLLIPYGHAVVGGTEYTIVS